MEFTEFIKLLKSIIGGASSNHDFTRIIFGEIVTDEGQSYVEDKSDSTFKSYYNGNTKITAIAKRILPYIEPEEFTAFLEHFPDATIQRLCDAFQPYILDITLHNAYEKIADFFEDILRTAASQQRKNTHTSVREDIIELPERQLTTEYSYSSEDILLLQEFTSDYDEIMQTMIGENYTSSLIDMSLPNKIQILYEKKWISKSNMFCDPTLKSYVFGLLGELNKLHSSLLITNHNPVFIRKIRTTIRNLYVKLHPDSFSEAFPYDAFIDDWNDGEF